MLVLVPMLTVAGWRAIRDSTAAQNVGVISSLSLPQTPTALIAALDEANEVTSITVIALRPEGGGGTIVSVPVGARSLSSPESPRRVADSYSLLGRAAFVADVESLMSATMSATAVVHKGKLAALLEPLGDVDVTLTDDLLDSVIEPSDPATATDTVAPTDSAPPDTTAPSDTTPTTPPTTDVATDAPAVVDESLEVVVPSGSTRLSPPQLADALIARMAGEPETSRLDAIGEIWDGVASSIGPGRGEPPAAGADDPTEVADIVKVLASGPIDVWQISSTPITDAEKNPQGLDLYKVRSGEIALVMSSVAPSAMAATLPGPTMQLDSAFGDADTSLAAVELLHFFNINVILTRDVPGDPPDVSIVRYAEVGESEDFSFLEEIIGPIRVERVDSRVEGIDFQVVLGRSFLPYLEQLDFDPSADVVPTDSVPTNDSTPPFGEDS